MNGAIRYRVRVEAVVQRVKADHTEWAAKERTPVQVPGTTTAYRDEYGWTPRIEKQVEETVEIYDQAVDQLDIAALVAVVNGIVPREDIA